MGPFYKHREEGLVLFRVGAETLGIHADSRVPIEPPGARQLRQWILPGSWKARYPRFVASISCSSSSSNSLNPFPFSIRFKQG